LPGTTGWDQTLGDRFGVPWNPQVLASHTGLGAQANWFGFTITGTSNMVIVVEACADLANPIWYPLQTNTLTGASCDFSDLQSTNYPSRFYRLRWP
jgi:hypothetical protein